MEQTRFLTVIGLWAAGLGAAAQFGKLSVSFSLLADHYGSGGAALGFAVSLVGFVGILFGVTGVSDFAGHPVFNLVLGAVLVFFALNLLGLFEIRPPAFLVSGVNKLEMKFGRAAALVRLGDTRAATDELHDDQCISDGTWANLANHWNEQQLLDLIFTVGQYTLVSMALNSAGVQLDAGIPGWPS